MERHDLETYGPHLAGPKGYIAHVGDGEYRHRFGGSSWEMVDPDKLGYGPTLLLTLDLQDPRLAAIGAIGLDELPLCAYLNCISMRRQVYALDASRRKIVLQDRTLKSPIEMLDDDILIPNPPPEKGLCLRDMAPDEYPTDEDLYWNCCDEFLGGSGVIRVLGPPVWMQWVEEETCACGRSMQYVASIGYEIENDKRELLDSEPFFPGEMAFYFFFCRKCSAFVVFDQSV